MDQFNWMAWTWQTAAFFGTVVLALVAMTIWEVKKPSLKRVGFLQMATTRGDRFFLILLGSAFIHLFAFTFTELTGFVVVGICVGFGLLLALKG